MLNSRAKIIGLFSVGMGIAYALGLLTAWNFNLGLKGDEQSIPEGATNHVPAPLEITPTTNKGTATPEVSEENKGRDPREGIPWAEWSKLAGKAPTLEQVDAGERSGKHPSSARQARRR